MILLDTDHVNVLKYPDHPPLQVSQLSSILQLMEVHGCLSRTVSAMPCTPFLERITLSHDVVFDNAAMQGE